MAQANIDLEDAKDALNEALKKDTSELTDNEYKKKMIWVIFMKMAKLRGASIDSHGTLLSPYNTMNYTIEYLGVS